MTHDPNTGAGIVKARPEKLPEPSYWPFFMALGLAFAGWGLLSTWLISVGGLIIFVIAMSRWINRLRHE
jgi:hypothetical protein